MHSLNRDETGENYTEANASLPPTLTWPPRETPKKLLRSLMFHLAIPIDSRPIKHAKLRYQCLEEWF